MASLSFSPMTSTSAGGDVGTRVHTRPVGERPVIELEPTDHPLAVEQRTGITLDRVREIAAALLHSGDVGGGLRDRDRDRDAR